MKELDFFVFLWSGVIKHFQGFIGFFSSNKSAPEISFITYIIQELNKYYSSIKLAVCKYFQDKFIAHHKMYLFINTFIALIQYNLNE